jgi:glycosyltransferase involved in cell wall biosynthesis
VEAEFSHVRLQVLGHYPQGGKLQELAGDSKQIEILKARPHPEALRIIANAGVFVLASRTEGAGRVLVEAMAAGKPVIASRVGGIPEYVKDGVNGLLFEAGDVAGLAEKLRLMLSSPELRKRLGAKGYDLARNYYDEVAYGREFGKMIELAVLGVNSIPPQVGTGPVTS